MYGLTAADLALQAKARAFADDLIPHEEYAEAHGGLLPDGMADQHRKRPQIADRIEKPQLVGGFEGVPARSAALRF